MHKKTRRKWQRIKLEPHEKMDVFGFYTPDELNRYWNINKENFQESKWVDEYLKSGDPNDAVRKAYPEAKGHQIYSISRRNQKKYRLNAEVLLGKIIDGLSQGKTANGLSETEVLIQHNELYWIT